MKEHGNFCKCNVRCISNEENTIIIYDEVKALDIYKDRRLLATKKMRSIVQAHAYLRIGARITQDVQEGERILKTRLFIEAPIMIAQQVAL